MCVVLTVLLTATRGCVCCQWLPFLHGTIAVVKTNKDAEHMVSHRTSSTCGRQQQRASCLTLLVRVLLCLLLSLQLSEDYRTVQDKRASIFIFSFDIATSTAALLKKVRDACAVWTAAHCALYVCRLFVFLLFSFQRKFQTVIIDESHAIKNGKGERRACTCAQEMVGLELLLTAALLCVRSQAHEVHRAAAEASEARHPAIWYACAESSRGVVHADPRAAPEAVSEPP